MQLSLGNGRTCNTTMNLTGLPERPVNLRWSDARMRLMRPELYGFSGLVYWASVKLGIQTDDQGIVRACFRSGETAPAVVVNLNPLRVAVLAREVDCVLQLEFPQSLIAYHGLSLGTRLLAINNYADGNPLVDFVPGPQRMRGWTDVLPLVADFLSDDLQALDKYKQAIPDVEWQRTLVIGRQMAASDASLYRDGRPYLSFEPIAKARAYEAQLQTAQSTRKVIVGVLGGILCCVLSCCGGLVSIGRGLHPKTRDVAWPPPRREAPTMPAPSVGAPLTPRGLPTPSLPEPDGPHPNFEALRAAMDAEHQRISREMDQRMAETREAMKASESRRSFDSRPPDTRNVTLDTALEPGDRLLALWGSRWWNARVVKTFADGTVEIAYDGWTGTERITRSKLVIPD